ncbi:cob(I)yrinic acid a,c-diamide adenosyltransferase [Roseibacterium beibuensis]|uniref:Corrinoid adenosyltransferase n=1 Tax=[Roseibacterium] beibuensis TaxID=1193142 RepID=A0ABP9L4J6_9RHOB|nr:cob(I)yrinic acid a,c-diamide adenosyltransferase [Roseibacterium beibuensis]MCS6621479.1 cob(I)yrinic acid a,c-diamide adenosyltransferase [Roseibacterium beibuensis]
MTTETPSTAPTLVVTRTGDSGETDIGTGRVLKSAPRIEAYGTVDEANAVIGVLRTAARDDSDLDGWLREIQTDLLNIGTDLHMAGEANEAQRFKSAPTERIEGLLESLNASQPPLTSFVLPTGVNAAGAYAHLARTVVRRAERRVVALSQVEAVNPEVQAYLNRLADFLFVVSRALNEHGTKDDVWAS